MSPDEIGIMRRMTMSFVCTLPLISSLPSLNGLTWDERFGGASGPLCIAMTGPGTAMQTAIITRLRSRSFMINIFISHAWNALSLNTCPGIAGRAILSVLCGFFRTICGKQPQRTPRAQRISTTCPSLLFNRFKGQVDSHDERINDDTDYDRQTSDSIGRLKRHRTRHRGALLERRREGCPGR